jgi:hypothetical protein
MVGGPENRFTKTYSYLLEEMGVRCVDYVVHLT